MNLNSQQQFAVHISDGPILIIAGPGTGKTRTLVSRINYLVSDNKIDPASICALTFTTKAADEIKNRLSSSIRKMPRINTFHGLAYSSLSDEIEDMQIANDIQRSQIIRKHNIGISSRDTLLLISHFKRQQALKTHIPEQWKRSINQYNHALHENKLIDYDDILIAFYNKLIRDALNKNTKIQNKFSHVLVDEFQDTNALQYECLKLLKPIQNNYFVIGDPLQSIYAFQGAHPDIFNDFKTDFPHCSEVLFEINYRSSAEIVSASASLFPARTLPRALPETRSNRDTVHIVQTIDEYSEAQFVAQAIDELIGGSDLIKASQNFSKSENISPKNQTRFSDIAVLYRTHTISKYIEEALEKSSIPFQRVGGNSLFEQPDVEKIINSMENIFIEQPNSNIALSYILSQYEADNNESLQSKYIQELRSILLHFDNYKEPLKEFFSYLKHIEETHYYDDSSDRVTLSTLHASKGLEFPYVFIIGCDEGIIPYIRKSNSLKTPETDIDEEKRLLYVGMTRAGQQLCLLTTEFRRRKKQKPSRFLKLLETSGFHLTYDPAIQKIIQQRRRRQEKKSQLKLF